MRCARRTAQTGKLVKVCTLLRTFSPRYGKTPFARARYFLTFIAISSFPASANAFALTYRPADSPRHLLPNMTTSGWSLRRALAVDMSWLPGPTCGCLQSTIGLLNRERFSPRRTEKSRKIREFFGPFPVA